MQGPLEALHGLDGWGGAYCQWGLARFSVAQHVRRGDGAKDEGEAGDHRQEQNDRCLHQRMGHDCLLLVDAIVMEHESRTFFDLDQI